MRNRMARTLRSMGLVALAIVGLISLPTSPVHAQTGCVPVVISGTTASIPGTSFSIAVPAGTPSGSFTACNNGTGTGTVTGALVPGGSCTGPVPGGTNQAAFFTAVSACFSTAAAAPLTQTADAARNASQVGMSVIQTQNQSIRDQIRWKLKLLRRSGNRVLGFAGQPDEDEATARTDLPRATSAYAGRGLVTKAPPKAPDSFSVNYSTWAVGFVDHERRDETFAGADIGRRATTGGGIGGVLAILQGLPFAKPDDILI